MFDTKLVQQEDFSYDLEIENGDFVIDDALETALTVSLLSDRRADESQVAQPELRRGWIGDLVTTLSGYLFGSHLWLNEQSRATQETLNSIKDAAEKALQWLLDTGLALKVEARTSFVELSSVRLDIIITSPDGSVSNIAFNLWKRTTENAT